MESILSKAEDFSSFSKMNSTSDIYSKFGNIFRSTISRGHFYLSILQEMTVYWCDWYYFPVRSIFSAKDLVRQGTRIPCTTCLKKDAIPLYA